MLRIADEDRVRTICLERPDALNAFNEALYDATTEALIAAAASPEVAVVVLTGAGRSFSAGTDVLEMAARTTDPEGFRAGTHGFPGLIDQLSTFPKPLICAVNGLALGIGATLLGFADLVIMSSDARIRCPFTDLAVAPEAGSSYTFPLLLGRQEASWVLMSSTWLSAEDCLGNGLAWRVVPPDRLMAETLEVARLIAAKPIASLIETKRTLVAGHRDAVDRARQRENTAFGRLLGQPANLEAFRALGSKAAPDFISVDGEHPVDVTLHRRD
ncbi:MAG TPA: enoyl-CoA hydratase-related protein [Acidimicrobiales bacterium]|nr:enoyl-CoA hydratase-related protein [Acidimicrobiales bacterium]